MPKPVLPLLVAAALCAAGPVACGDGDAQPAGAPAPAALTGATTSIGTAAGPPAGAATTTAATPRSPLAANAARANRFVGAGRDDLKRELAALTGHPVVVNLWASWCGPCRFEFPFFAAAAKRHGERVGFVGVDVMDSRDPAEQFVDERPPGFPSVYDDDGKAARSLGGGRVMPTTFFLDRTGRVVHTKLGGYAKAEQLDADIRRYALGAA